MAAAMTAIASMAAPVAPMAANADGGGENIGSVGWGGFKTDPSC
jgi:hypothetical protein